MFARVFFQDVTSSFMWTCQNISENYLFKTKCSKIIILGNTCFTCRDKNIIKIYNNISLLSPLSLCLSLSKLNEMEWVTTSKNKLFFPTSCGHGCTQGICRVFDLQVLKVFDVILWLTSVILDHMQKQKNNGGEKKSLHEMDSI